VETPRRTRAGAGSPRGVETRGHASGESPPAPRRRLGRVGERLDEISSLGERGRQRRRRRRGLWAWRGPARCGISSRGSSTTTGGVTTPSRPSRRKSRSPSFTSILLDQRVLVASSHSIEPTSRSARRARRCTFTVISTATGGAPSRVCSTSPTVSALRVVANSRCRRIRTGYSRVPGDAPPPRSRTGRPAVQRPTWSPRSAAHTAPAVPFCATPGPAVIEYHPDFDQYLASNLDAALRTLETACL